VILKSKTFASYLGAVPPGISKFEFMLFISSRKPGKLVLQVLKTLLLEAATINLPIIVSQRVHVNILQ
jgi:hypothetical protein